MKIAVACDHGGYKFARKLLDYLNTRNHQPQYFGCNSEESCDYPDLAIPAAVSIIDGNNDRGIFVCTTGIGMCITANKIPGIKAALVYDDFTAKSSRLHNNANVLCLGASRFNDEQLFSFIEIWLNTTFDCGANPHDTIESRHLRRVSKIEDLEAEGINLPEMDKNLLDLAIKDFQTQIRDLETSCPVLLEHKKYWVTLEENTPKENQDLIRSSFAKAMGPLRIELIDGKSFSYSFDQKLKELETRINILQQMLSIALQKKQRTT